jgi:hypothetical protein
MIAAENSAVDQEKTVSSLEGQWRCQQFMLQAPQYIVRVFLQEQESSQVENKFCYFLPNKKRNNWCKVENKFEFK